MRKISFKTKLLVSFWTLILVAAILPFAYYVRAVDQDLVAQAKEQAGQSLGLVLWSLGNHAPFEEMRAFDDWTREISRQMGGIRVTYIVDGRVVADSDVPFNKIPELDYHGDRPEVVEAKDKGQGISVRHSATLAKKLIYAARLAPDPGAGLPAGVLRLAIPVSAVSEQLSRIRQTFFVVLAAGLGAALLVSLLLSRWLARSLEILAATVRAIGRGEYSMRVRTYPGREFEPLAKSVNAMAGAIEEAVRNLSEQKRRIEAVLNGMSEGVLVLDSSGRIESYNQAMAAMFPDVARSMGKSVIEATLEPSLQKSADMLVAGPDGVDRVVTHIEKPGKRFIEVSLEPFSDPLGERKVVMVFHDISELKRLEAMRRDFVANVSHELRTPVTSIRGYAETLLDSDPDEEHRKKFLTIIERNASHMSKLVSDLLALARLEYDGESFEREPVDVKGAAEAVMAELSGLAAEKKISLKGDFPEKGVLVMARDQELKQVFRNLVENAVKFSPEGGEITVSASVDDLLVTMAVEDQGPGIPAGSRERIFERFYRVGRPSDKSGSTGLGLSICRNILRVFGGHIRVESPADPETGLGSRFVFTLEAAPDAESEEA